MHRFIKNHWVAWIRLKHHLWRVWWKKRDQLLGGRRRLSAGERALHQAVSTGNVQNVEILLLRGANANLRGSYDMPLLMLAASAGHREIVRLLLQAGAQVDASNPSTQHTALMFAAKNGHCATMALLLSYGANIEAANRAGTTALLAATLAGQTEAVQFLLQEYAARRIRPGQERVALGAAKKYGFQEIVALLKQDSSPPMSKQSGDESVSELKERTT